MQKQTECRRITNFIRGLDSNVVRLWGRNPIGKPVGVLVNNEMQIVSSQSESDCSTKTLAGGIFVDDLNYLSKPAPETFELLNKNPDDYADPPDGIFFSDVYGYSDGNFALKSRGEDVDSISDLVGGLTGPGIEFLYSESMEDAYQTRWDYNVPVFRDSMTPSIPDQTTQFLFRYGTNQKKTSDSASCEDEPLRPKLKSAI